jgi:simple sugar transport system ATP-binding protein
VADLEQHPLVEMNGISKNFGAIKALQNVDLTLYHDEILGLVGDNAAGKSTLMKILTGVHRADGGKIFVEGKEVAIDRPCDARALGIEMVYQDFALAPNLDVIDNIFLGREETKNHLGLIKVLDKSGMRQRAMNAIQALQVDMGSLDSLVRFLSGGQQQAVAIARATLYRPKVIVMDEPSASLSVKAIQRLLELMKRFKEEGISLIFITHRLPDIFSVSDRIMVLRAGKKVAEKKITEVTLDSVIKLILGLT